MSYLSEEDLAAIGAKLHTNAPYLIGGVSRGMFSVARFSGGCKFQGYSYTYIRETDELVRNDVMKAVAKMRKAKRPAGGEQRSIQEA